MGESKNIIIFDDFAVFSSYPKEITLNWLRQSARFLATYSGSFPEALDERILITLTKKVPDSPITSLFVSSSVSLCDTLDIVERVTDLLETNETDFFCPDESF